MTLYQFNQLDEMEQIEAIWYKGVEIGERLEGEFKITLYQIDSFYVEKWFHIEHEVIKRFRSFSSTDQLKPYTDSINLNGFT